MSNEQEHVDDVIGQLLDAAADVAHVADFDQHLKALTSALADHGLTATRGIGDVIVRNPAEMATEPRGRAMSPDLKQRVTIADHCGEQWWCWIWPGPSRDAPCEMEPMVPVGDVEEAARRLGNVLRIDRPDTTQA